MKKMLVLVLILVALFSVQHADAKKPLSKKKHTIIVKTNLSPKRGKVYIRVYPHAEEGEEGKGDCKNIKQDLPRKGFSDDHDSCSLLLAGVEDCRDHWQEDE